MNNQNLMMRRDVQGLIDPDELIVNSQVLKNEDAEYVNNFENMSNMNNGMMMMRRDANGEINTVKMPTVEEKKIMAAVQTEEPEAPAKKFSTISSAQMAAANQVKSKTEITNTVQTTQQMAQQQLKQQLNNITSDQKQKSQAQNQMQKPANNASAQNTANAAAQAVTNAQKQQQPAAAQSKPAQTAPPQTITSSVTKIRNIISLDDMTKAYIKMFKDHFDMDLSSSICFENMRKMCEITNIKEPDKTLYFIENTYRLSTILYLTGNLPILIIASILSEKNRKNILKYVTAEVENGAKPYDDLKEFRMKRWMNKYANMHANDAITVTPGATILTPELSANIQMQFDDICTKVKKYSKDMSKKIVNFDDDVKNDIIYIYSNWWYLLQGFENLPEMRDYIMAITDDTRKNLKI